MFLRVQNVDWILGWVACLIAFISVFFPSWKIIFKIVVERCFWEFKMLFGSLVELHAWLHSYLCFSLLEKLFLSNLNSSSTPLNTWLIYRAHLFFFSSQSRYLSIARWIDQETSCPFDTSSIHRVYFAMDTSRKLHLSKLLKFDTSLTSLNTSICRELLNTYIRVQTQSDPHFLDLSQSVHVFSPPKPLSLAPNLFLKDSSSLFKFFFTW